MMILYPLIRNVQVNGMDYVWAVVNVLLMLGHWAHQPTKMYYNGLPHPKIMDGPVELGIESLL
jgi:anaerobic selenocysteine-containing dehydrogenase